MNRPLSVAIVTPTVSRAGGGIFPIVLAHVKELIALGLDVTTYGLDCDPMRLDRDAWNNLPLTTYQPRSGGYNPRLLRDLIAADHDVVHQHGLWLYPSFAASRWRATTGRPVVVSTQGMLEPWALANSAWKKRIAGALFERHHLNHAAAIHCSAAEVEGVKAYAPATTIAVIPNGVYLPESGTVPKPKASVQFEDRRSLLFLGRLHPKKGVAELVRSIALLKATSPELVSRWRLLVGGWGEGRYAAELETLSCKLGLTSDEICFLGPCFGDEKAAILAHSDAFVLPSYSEGFPMAVLEAWSFSLPVLMTKECNIPEGFAAGAAVRVENQPEALARDLAACLARDDLHAIGEAGRQLVERKFSWPAVVSELASVYSWLVNGGSQPSSMIKRR